MDDCLASRMDRVSASAIMSLLKTTAGGGYINFASGLPDSAFFPAEDIRRIAAGVLESESEKALQYGAADGYAPLKEWIAAELRRRGLRDASPGSILVTQGSQQALDLAAKLLVSPGDWVCLESPTYLAGLQTFDSYEARYSIVPLANTGMDTAAVEAALEAGCKVLYALPNSQNPSGLTMSEASRERIREAIRSSGAWLIEDDAYNDLRYQGDALTPLSAGLNRAFYTGTFSKTVAPGLRVGYVHGPKEAIERLGQLKQITDLCSGTLAQHVVYRYVTECDYQAQIERIRAANRGRLGAMLGALEVAMPETVRWTRPSGGMFLWLDLPNGLDATDLLNRTMSRGVAFVPGAGFCPDGKGRNALRLNFVSEPEGRIREGIRVLAECIQEST